MDRMIDFGLTQLVLERGMKIKYAVLMGALIIACTGATGAHSEPVSKSLDTTKISQEIAGIESRQIHAQSWIKRRDYLEKERRASNRRHTNLPRAHVEYCTRLLSDYHQWDNTIADARYSRIQCSSPHYRPY